MPEEQHTEIVHVHTVSIFIHLSLTLSLSLSGKSIKRSKGSRVAKVDRSRMPLPLPRSAKMKTQHIRASPSSRKRRFSGRTVRPLQIPNAAASEEGDMAQADEMGEGEGRDDGFVDGGEAVKRRSKKRSGRAEMYVC